jgi:hypothetical protein
MSTSQWFAFIDEAGDSGWDFEQGSSHLLILTAAIIPHWYDCEEFFSNLNALVHRKPSTSSPSLTMPATT